MQDADLDQVIARIDPKLCVACKGGRMLCGIDPCPLLQKIRTRLPKVQVGSRDLFGSSPPSLFVGRYGYPNVSVGPMLPPDHRNEAGARLLDAPQEWMRMTIPDVVGLRSSLVRTTHKVEVRQTQAAGDIFSPDRILRVSQELALAARPVDTEVRLRRPPRFGEIGVGDFEAPHGPTVEVQKAALAENPRVEPAIERAANDTDLRAAEAITGLYGGGASVYHLERILSAGLLGLGRGRRLVPTRWSITATDDQIGLGLIEEVKLLPTIDKPVVHAGERFGNRFHILLVPRVWGFDSLEVWMKGSFWSREVVAEEDFEDHDGRTTYAATAGGYYATRLSVLEHLIAIKRQATAIVLREITDAYTTPLGVWVVRETAKLALSSRPLEFEDLDSALRHVDRHALHKDWRRHARLLERIKTQRSLDAY